MRAYEAEARIAALRQEAERSDRATAGAPPRVASAPPRTPATRRAAPASQEPRADAPPDAEARSDRLDPAWDALIDETLRAQVLARLGHSLAPEQEARLLERLREVRRAAVEIERAGDAQDEKARLRQRLSRTLVLLEADRAFRDELGIGVGEFLAGLDPGRVEEVAAPGGPGPEASVLSAPRDLAGE